MKFDTKYKLLLWKSYLDTGIGLTYYFKYLILLFGLMSQDFEFTVIAIIVYGRFCFLLGYAYFRFGWMEAGQEVTNRFNRFVKEMRKSVKRKT